jgi:hypothetical protein
MARFNQSPRINRETAFAVLLLSGAVVLAACSGDNDAAQTPTSAIASTLAPTVAVETLKATPPARAEAAPVSNQTPTEIAAACALRVVDALNTTGSSSTDIISEYGYGISNFSESPTGMLEATLHYDAIMNSISISGFTDNGNVNDEYAMNMVFSRTNEGKIDSLDDFGAEFSDPDSLRLDRAQSLIYMGGYNRDLTQPGSFIIEYGFEAGEGYVNGSFDDSKRVQISPEVAVGQCALVNQNPATRAN